MPPIQVAIIEDHELTRMGLRVTLSQQPGVKVIGEAANGPKGLALLMSARPDIALVDIQLPGFDGIELTQQFKQWQREERPRTLATRVIMLTAQEHEATVLAAFGAGADSYCLKHISTQCLLEALAVTYAGNSWIDPGIVRIVLNHISQRQTVPTVGITTPVNNEAMLGDKEHNSSLLASSPLTNRELEVLELIVAGCSNLEIASRCYIALDTVKTHVRSILDKLCVDCRTQAATIALRSGLVN